MGQRSRRRQPPVDKTTAAEAELIALMLDALPEVAHDIAGPAVGGIDIDPLLVALLAGVLDDHLEGIAAIVTARHASTWLVQLDEPVGRYATGELKVRSTQLEPEGPE